MSLQTLAEKIIAGVGRDGRTDPRLFHPGAKRHADLTGGEVDEIAAYFENLSHRFHTVWTAEDVVCSGDRIAIRWTERAWPADSPEPAPDTPAVHETVTITIFRIEEGQIAEMWVARDDSFYFRNLDW